MWPKRLAEAIGRIHAYTIGVDEVRFRNDPMLQDAVIRNMEIVGEASRHIERHHPAFAAAHPELPLGAAYEMRNALAHGYFKADLGVVWRTLQTDLPALGARVHELLRQLSH